MPATNLQVLRGLLLATQLAVFIILFTWIFGFLGGVSLRPIKAGFAAGSNDTNRLFNWHPLLMTLAWIGFSAEALLAYRSPYIKDLNRQQQKTLHATLNTTALFTAILAVIFAWKSHTLKRPDPIPNLYSPHSWLGVLTLSLAVVHLLIGVGTYVWPKLSASRRAAAYPYHAFLGAVTFSMALATMLIGIQEKTSFVQVFMKAPVYSPAIRLPAVLALFVVLTGILLAAYHAAARKEQHDEPGASDAVDYERVV
jgi:cytochrome b561